MADWTRIEAMTRSIGLEGGLQARIGDPAWMMARQWQVGEFRGDDAAQPAAVKAGWQTVPLTTYQTARSGGARPLPPGRPLESVVEASPSPDIGDAGLYVAAWGSRRLIWLLRRRGLGAAVESLRAAFPLAAPERMVAAGASGRAAVALLVGRAIDAPALAGAAAERVRSALATVLVGADVSRAVATLTEWRRWYSDRVTPVAGAAWDDERLEHEFTVEASDDGSEVRLHAGEHDGGDLDWYTFDCDSTQTAPAPALRVTSVLPTPARYHGMPASRWWEFEPGEVNFGEVEAGPADLARLLVAEFTVGYSGDWFVMPVRVPTGCLVEVRRVTVLDIFGGSTPVASVAAVDDERLGERRAWRLFELTGDELTTEHAAPWLLVPPATVGDLEGPSIEEIGFARDEGANLVWGIETLVEGPLGRAVNRAEAWHVTGASGDPSDGPAGRAPSDLATGWQYRLESEAPPWWIPFLPERVDPSSDAQVRLRRARMQSWSLLDRRYAGPQSTLLDPRRPRWLSEEQVPKDGVRVEIRWRYARWRDGSVHLWRQRHRRPGRGERSSGLRWDLLADVGESQASNPPQ